MRAILTTRCGCSREIAVNRCVETIRVALGREPKLVTAYCGRPVEVEIEYREFHLVSHSDVLRYQEGE